MTTQTAKQIPRIREAPLLGSTFAFKFRPLEFLDRVKHEHGDVARFHLGTAEMVAVVSGPLAYAILVAHAPDFIGGARNKLFRPVAGDLSLLTLDGDLHRQQRRISMLPVQQRTVVNYADAMGACAARVLARWKDGEIIDVNAEIREIALRVLAKTLFDIDAIEQHRDLWAAMDLNWDYIEYVASSAFPVPWHWPTRRNRRTRAAVALIRDRMQAMMDARRGHTADRNDMLSILMHGALERGGGPSQDEEARIHALNLFGAGYETIASALTWAVYLLYTHPECVSRARAEVDSVLTDANPSLEDLRRLPYALQVLKEGMRIYPPGYLTSCAAAREVEVLDYRFPQFQQILISPYVIHRDPEVFPQPDRFDPDRFSPDREKQIPRYAYMPFRVGSHQCIGNHFALMEGHIVLASVLRAVDLEIVAPERVRPVPGLFLRPSTIHAKVKRRCRDAGAGEGAS